MDELWQRISADWPGGGHLLFLAFQLVLAAVVGALPGLQREIKGVPAGLRTHMLVSLGSAIFVLGSLESGANADNVTRVIQGLAAGIGFVGAGAILKPSDNEVRGLTTAASIWLTAALGSAVGLGQIWLPILGSIASLAVLGGIKRIEPAGLHHKYSPPHDD